MSINVNIEFSVVNRINVHAKNGNEWALNARVLHGQFWTIATWNKEPSEKAVADTKAVMLQSIKFWCARPTLAEYPVFTDR